MELNTTIIDAGVNAFQGSIYGGILQQKMTPDVATKSGVAGLTNAKHGSFYTGSIAEPAVCVTVPNTQQLAYFTNDSIRELSQTRVLKQTSIVPLGPYTMRFFGIDATPLNGQGYPLFNAIENGLFFNMNPCLCSVQIGFTRNATPDLAPFGTASFSIYGDYANVGPNDDFVITSVLLDQYNMPISTTVGQPESLNISFDVPSPVTPAGTLIRPMPFYFVGIRLVAAFYEGGSLAPVPFDGYAATFSATTTITIDDLSLTGDEVAGVLALNDYAGPFEAIQDIRFAAIPNVKNSALLGPYILPPEYTETTRVVKDFLSTILGRSGGLIGSGQMYRNIMDSLGDKDKAYVMAPKGGYNMSSLSNALRQRMVTPSRHLPDNNYFASSLLRKMRGLTKKVMRSPFGDAIKDVGNQAYKIGGNMLYEAVEDQTGVDFRELADSTGLRGRHSSSYYSSSYDGGDFGNNRYDPALTRPAMFCSSFKIPKAFKKDAHPSVISALSRVKKGLADIDDRALVTNILSAAGQTFREGYHSSDAPTRESDDEAEVVSKRVDPSQFMAASYGTVVSRVKVPAFNAVSASLSRIIERKTSPHGQAHFISIAETPHSPPLIMTCIVATKLPSTTQNFTSYYFRLIGDSSVVQAILVSPEESASVQIRFSTLLNFSTEGIQDAVTYLLRCGIVFQNTEYVLVDESYSGEPLRGDSFILAFVMACLQVPLGPIFSGTVMKNGAIGRIGDSDIKIAAVASNDLKPTLLIARTEVTDESQGIIDRTLVRLNYFRIGTTESNVVQVDSIAHAISMLFSTAMSPSVSNSTHSFIVKDRLPDLSPLSAGEAKAAKQVAAVGRTIDQARTSAVNKVIKDQKGAFMQAVSSNKGFFTHNGERIDTTTIGKFNKLNPSFGTSSVSIPEALAGSVELEYDNQGTVQIIQVTTLDATKLTPITKSKKPSGAVKAALTIADFDEY
jgi:hypothetical protein